MYGHDLLPSCAMVGCISPGLVTLDNKIIMCAAHAILHPNQF